MFSPTPPFYARRLASIRKVAGGCDEILNGRPLQTKIVCSRYTDGLPRVDTGALAKFSSELRAYALGTESALATRPFAQQSELT